MEYALGILVQIGIMVILIAVGFALFKLKIINSTGRKQISELVLTIVCPSLILTAFQVEYKEEYTTGLLWSFGLAALSIIIGIVLSKLVIPKRFENNIIDRFNIIYSNCGFIGIPLVNGIFGAEGVLYVTGYLTMFNIIVWSHGVMMMKGEFNAKSILSVLKAPTIIGVILGVLFYMLQIKIPKIPLEALNYIASLNTPLAMIIAGASIAEAKLAETIKKPTVLWSCFVKLLLLPIIVMFVFKLIPIQSELVYTTIIIATACPSAAIGTMFALRHNKNAVYSSELFSLSTLLSCVTLPIIVLLSGIIFSI